MRERKHVQGHFPMNLSSLLSPGLGRLLHALQQSQIHVHSQDECYTGVSQPHTDRFLFEALTHYNIRAKHCKDELHLLSRSE